MATFLLAVVEMKPHSANPEHPVSSSTLEKLSGISMLLNPRYRRIEGGRYMCRLSFWMALTSTKMVVENVLPCPLNASYLSSGNRRSKQL